MSLFFFKRHVAKRYASLQALKTGALDSEQQQVNFGARFFAHLVTMLIVACFSPCFSCNFAFFAATHSCQLLFLKALDARSAAQQDAMAAAQTKVIIAFLTNR